MSRCLRLMIFVLAAMAFPGCFGDVAPGADTGVDGSSDAWAPDAQPPRQVGELCVARNQCVDDASCIGTAGGEPFEFVCMQKCSEPGRICADGSVCTARVSSNTPICYTGGDTAHGQPCETNLDCISGALCFGTNAERYCLNACHERDPHVCPEDTSCRVGSTSSQGLCRSLLGAQCASTDECSENLVCTVEIAELSGWFRGGLCTVDDCASDQDCPHDGVCRTPPGADRAICLNRCQSHGDCRFNQDYRCLSGRYCQQIDGSGECEAFRDGADVCFPPVLFP